MHLYKLADLKSKKMSGGFRVAEWQLPGVGTLRGFFWRQSDSAKDSAYLFYLNLLPTTETNVQRKQGGGYVLIRSGTPQIEWDVRANRVSVSRGLSR